MTRKQAINYLISSGFSDEQVSEVVRALTYEPTTKIEESNFSQEQYLADIQSAYDCGKSVIDKIRAEIEREVLDKLRAEIECLETYYDTDYFSGNKDAMFKRSEVLDILDKYKAETEDT